MRLRLAALCGLVIGMLLLGGCAERQPSVILISVESLRADEVTMVRNGEAVAPNLATMMRESLVYEHAVTTAPWTTPAVMSLLTGLPSFAHGVDRHDASLDEAVPTLAERFHEAGYRTAGYAPAVTLRPEIGYGQGFEEYDYEPYGHDRISSPALTGKVMHKMEEWQNEPFFIWVHLWDPHYNYNPPMPYDQTFRRGSAPANDRVQCLKWIENPVTPEEADYLHGQYEGEIRYTDEYIGRVLEAIERLELRDDVIVAVVGDHGEAFLEHGWLGHTNRVDEVLIHVPMFVRPAGRAPVERVTQPVSTASIGARLLEMAGLSSEGFGLFAPAPHSDSETDTARALPPVSQTERRGCYTTLVEGTLKYVIDHRDCSEQLFDLAADPGETTDLATERAEDLVRLRLTLEEVVDEVASAGIPRADLPMDIQEDSEERLRAIGYIGGGQQRLQTSMCAGIELTGPIDNFGDVMADPPCPEAGLSVCQSKLLKER